MKVKKYLFRFYAPVLMCLLLFSCLHKKPEKNTSSEISDSPVISDTSYPQFTSQFKIKYYTNYKKLEVNNPWDSTGVIARYYLLAEGQPEPVFTEPGTVIIVPVTNMACLSATQIAMASKLGVLQTITGVSETSFIRNKIIREKILNTRVTDLGSENQINLEKLLDINPDILMISPYGDDKFSKLSELGIALGFDASYLETTPLARAEWIKFFSYFFNKEKLANEIFNDIKSKYLSLKESVIPYKKPPTILSGKKFGQSWHVPAGNSYMGNFYRDAGVNYLWSDNAGTGSIPLDFETVYNIAHAADFWCFKVGYNGNYSKKDLLKEYENYSDFKAFKTGRIIICNTLKTDFYEIGFLEPHIILADLLSIFYPGSVPDHKKKYFQIIN